MKQKVINIRLEPVKYMPKELEPGVLYVSEEFGTAAHLCPCGCGSKIRTPLGPTEWYFENSAKGPNLFPSVGNWQIPCKSHYWIKDGKVIWAGSWTSSQIHAGRRNEEKRRQTYYNRLKQKRRGIIMRFWHWVKRLFN